MRVAIAAARFNGLVVERLVEGAESCLRKEGVDFVTFWVPGAFELPLAAKSLVDEGYSAVVCLGAVIRGETSHFDLVAGEAARGIMQVCLDTGVPVIFGVLATQDVEQAMARAGGDHGNKGWDAASAALSMAGFVQRERVP